MLLKMDIKKAYDMVNWDALITMLNALGFNEKWCKWIDSCIRTVRFYVLVNGYLTELFNSSRGILQGDSISSLVFVLLTNTLSFLIQRSVERVVLRESN